jgi:branched-chain amino acid transport system substrate-binding protein
VPKVRGRAITVLAAIAITLSAVVTLAGGTAGAKSPSGSPIKLGFAIAQTGQAASIFKVAKSVVLAWEKSVNASGGIAGHKVDAIIVDSQSEPAAALAAAKSLVSQGVVAIMVGDTSAESAMVPYFSSQGIPDLGVFYDAADYSLKNVYDSGVSQAAAAAGTVTVAKGTGATKFAQIGCLESPACAQAGDLYQSIAPKVGITFTGKTLVAFNQPSYTAACLSAIGTGASFLELDLAPATQAVVATACDQQGFKGEFGAPQSAANIPFLTTIKGSKWSGVLNAFPWWVNNPQVNAFRAAMKKYAPSAPYQTPTATAYWAALQLFKQAMSGATGPVTTASVIKDLGKVKNQTLGGILAQPITWTANQSGNTLNCYWGYEYKAGNANPTSIPLQGKSGNGASGPLATTCYPLKK